MGKCRQYSIGLPPQLAMQVQEQADLWSLSLSALVRLAVEDLMANPDRLPALVAAWRGPIIDMTTPEQRARAEAYLKSLESVDLDILLAGMSTGPLGEGEICRASTAIAKPASTTARAIPGTT
jgi:hypothetical protein